MEIRRYDADRKIMACVALVVRSEGRRERPARCCDPAVLSVNLFEGDSFATCLCYRHARELIDRLREVLDSIPLRRVD